MRSTARVPVACGVDIGSTNSKVVALDANGSVVSRSSRPTPRDAEDLSIDARRLFNAVEELVLEVCGHRYIVHTISTAGVGEDGVLVDGNLQPLTKALAWFDPRRQGIFRALRPALQGDEMFDADTDSVRTIVGWKWSRDQAAAGSAHTWTALADLPGVLWSGRPYMSDTIASRTAAWRSSDRGWASPRVELTLGSSSLLPRVVRTGAVVGDFRSARLGAEGVVSSDAITVAGGHDHPIGGWGVDQISPGAVLDSMGTAEVVVAQSPFPHVGRHDKVDIAPGIQSDGTSVLRVEELARNVAWASQDPEVASHVQALLEGRLEPEDVLDSKYFVPGQRGGGRPSYATDAPRDPAARASAVLGALAFAGRDAVDAVRRDLADNAEVRLAGGWVRSPGWVRIKAIVNGYRTVPILEPEVTSVATALLAARGRGWNPDPARALSGAALVMSS